MTLFAIAEPLRQRAEYTHKPNLKAGRHGWLRLTPAYSMRVVEALMDHTKNRLRILDPFCGTATTALSAAYHGHDATTIDINPFLVWLGQAKITHYPQPVIARTRDVGRTVLERALSGGVEPTAPPPIHNIERWWNPSALVFLLHLRQAIIDLLEPSSKESTLLKIAFCRTLIGCSNAAFNHQSMSFKDTTQMSLDMSVDYAAIFRKDVDFVLHGATENPKGNARVLLHDARQLSTLPTEPFDLIVTSPPYANRMSYIRELRPYMYWLGFLEQARDAGELDWLAIGGTWGIATSRLNDWRAGAGAYSSQYLETTLEKISDPINENGRILATYIRKYCADMADHLRETRAILAPNAHIHYIVGNSTFYSQLLSVERIYADIMQSHGYIDINIKPIRKRNSKKELVEFDVSARWPG